ncbi:toprim domain-containing protein [Flavobacterium frigidarium]|uniref:Toprim domain-containing protein n=1 Tax=Flavobacterium frigidarium TaxID=99286 RepID=A0ABV4KCH1_9FLAO
MRKLNIEAVEKKKDQFWFKPQWREERTASAKCENNLFYDFGEGFGGNAVDYVMKHFAIDFMQAVRWLRNEEVIFSFDPHIPKISKSLNYSILKIEKIRNKNLISYLNVRGINLEFAKQFCVEINYVVNKEKQYYGIGFKNNNGGYEIRSQFFKGCLGKKEITTIDNNCQMVSLFESWSDFLSYLTLKKKVPDENFIILNSTSLIKKALEPARFYSEIKVFFDNDEAGDKATNFLLNNIKDKVTDYRIHYKNYNDLNEYLLARS